MSRSDEPSNAAGSSSPLGRNSWPLGRPVCEGIAKPMLQKKSEIHFNVIFFSMSWTLKCKKYVPQLGVLDSGIVVDVFPFINTFLVKKNNIK